MLETKDIVEFSKTLPKKLDKVADAVSYMEDFLRVKGIYKDDLSNCVEIAENLMLLFTMGIRTKGGRPFYPAIITIKSPDNAFTNPLKIRDINGEIHSYTHHTIFIPEFYVVDIMHGYKHIEINNYFEMLYELNGSIKFDYGLSFFTNYHFEDGISDLSKIVNIDYLCNL